MAGKTGSREKFLPKNFYRKSLGEQKGICAAKDFGSNEEQQLWMQEACTQLKRTQEGCAQGADYLVPGTPFEDMCVSGVQNGVSTTVMESEGIEIDEEYLLE